MFLGDYLVKASFLGDMEAVKVFAGWNKPLFPVEDLLVLNYPQDFCLDENIQDQQEIVPCSYSVRLTPLAAASFAGHVDIVQELIKAGASLDNHLFNSYSFSKQHHAIAENNHRDLSIFYQGMNEVFTPLMLAVIGNHINVVNILIQSGVDIHVGYRSTTDRRIPRTHEYNTTLAISAFMARWGLYKYKYNTALTLAGDLGLAPIYRLLRNAGAEDTPGDPCDFISFDMGCNDSLDMLGEDNIRSAINHLRLYLYARG